MRRRGRGRNNFSRSQKNESTQPRCSIYKKSSHIEKDCCFKKKSSHIEKDCWFKKKSQCYNYKKFDHFKKIIGTRQISKHTSSKKRKRPKHILYMSNRRGTKK